MPRCSGNDLCKNGSVLSHNVTDKIGRLCDLYQVSFPYTYKVIPLYLGSTILWYVGDLRPIFIQRWHKNNNKKNTLQTEITSEGYILCKDQSKHIHIDITR